MEAGKYIFQNQVKSYTTMTVTGAEAQHSSLPQNKQVVKIIQQYLLKQQVKPGPSNNQNSKHKSNSASD